MRNSDAFTWSMESDPRLRSTVVTVLLLDRSPDWDEVRQRFDLISREMPMFRQRVVESPPPAPPRWEPDADFELDYHMRRVTVSGAGTFEDVLEMARLAEMQDFDRARALWETTLIEGLQDGGAAVICKFHHALTDGVGGVQIAMHLFDLSAEVGAHPSLPAVAELPRHSWLDGYRDSWRYGVSMLARALTGAIKGGAAVAVQQPAAARSDSAIGRSQRRLGLPNRSATEPHRFSADQGTQFDPASRRPRGASAAVARGRPPMRGCTQRRIRGRSGRWTTPLS